MKNDIIYHPRFGKGKITNIDSTTYTCTMISAIYETYPKDEICRLSSEIYKEFEY